MAQVLATIAPVFGLLALGWLAARAGMVSSAAGEGLTVFVFEFAIPALLFRTLATTMLPEALPWGLWTAYFLGVAIAWAAAALLIRYALCLPATAGAACGMAAGFSNIVMLGIPIALGHFGQPALLPIALLLSIHTPVMWLGATLHIEWVARRPQTSPRRMLADLARTLFSNPILIAILAGALWQLTGLGLHPVPDRILELLGAAAVPGALFALGVALNQYGIGKELAATAAIAVPKLVLLPLVVWLLAFKALALPPVWAGTAVLFAALPTGANAFLFASRYDVAVAAVSGAIAITTICSLFTISAVLWLMS